MRVSFVVPLIYSAVIYHRLRREKRSYAAVDLSHCVPISYLHNNPMPYGTNPLYNHQYTPEIQGFVARDLEAGPGMERRASYNHERDTRFDMYQQERTSYMGR